MATTGSAVRMHAGEATKEDARYESASAKLRLPDGRTLGKVLADAERQSQALGASRALRKGNARETSTDLSEEEKSDPELQAAARIGARRRRRLMNERLLREMAGDLDAEAMRALFKPPPFGERRRTPLERVREPGNEHAYHALLAGSEEQETEGETGQQALNSRGNEKSDWLRVRRSAREAIKRLLEDAEDAEKSILAFLADDKEAGVFIDAWSSMRRLVVKGLCDWHGLQCHGEEGGMRVYLPRRGTPFQATTSCTDYVRRICRVSS